MGTTKYTCECGYYYRETNIPIDPDKHRSYAQIVNGSTENSHKEYSCCGKVVEDGSYHVFDEGTVLYAANCLVMGTTKYTCECGYYYKETNIPKDPDTHFSAGYIRNGSQANSHKEYSCCGKIVEDGSYHVFDEGTVLYAANCLFTGTTKYTCDCGYYYTEKDIPIDPNNHFSLKTNYEQIDNDYHNKTLHCYGCDYSETIKEEHILENNTCTSCPYKKED